MFLASNLLLIKISSNSFNLDSLSFLCFSAASIFSCICDFLNSKFALIFGNIIFDKIIYKIPNVNVSQNI